jgi:hypothetical protein
MSVEGTLLEIDRRLAAGGPDEYREHLTEEALLIVPGEALSKQETIAAMGESPGWDELRLDDVRTLELTDHAAVITYRFTGRRGEDFTYEALMSSTYVRRDGEWKLAFHQQTPLG